MSNPDAKHYWDHDVFTYITSLPDPVRKKDTPRFEIKKLKQGDTALYANGSVVLEKVVSKAKVFVSGLDPEDIASMATIKVTSILDSNYIAEPMLIRRKDQLFSLPDTVNEGHLVLQLRKIEGETLELGIKEINETIPYLTVKAYKFPFINLVWIGTFIMAIGFMMSMSRRILYG